MSYPLPELRSLVADRLARKPHLPDWSQGVLLYGAGNFGREVLALLRGKGIRVIAFLDGKIEQARECDGVTAHPLQSDQVDGLVAQDYPVVMTIHSHHANLSEISVALQKRGFSQVVTTMELYEHFTGELGSRYWLASDAYFLENAAAFLSGIDIWEDEPSREVYRRMLWYRFGRDLAAHPEPGLDDQYIPTDLPRWPQPIHLLDGGACEGDALKALVRSGYQVDQLYAWEPDFANFQKLQSHLREHGPQLGGAILFPCGLGSTLQTVAFDGSRGAASSISENGKDHIVVLPADLALTHHPVTLIKLDIEGAEGDALLGMRGLIQKNRPGLAICVYHRPDDLFRLPRLIQSWNLGYRFHLRIHCWNAFDLVMYAVPV